MEKFFIRHNDHTELSISFLAFQCWWCGLVVMVVFGGFVLLGGWDHDHIDGYRSPHLQGGFRGRSRAR